MLQEPTKVDERAASNADQARSHQTESGDRRPHLFPLAFGLLDSHFNDIDYLDTIGGDELRRLYRQRQAARHGADRNQRPSSAA